MFTEAEIEYIQKQYARGLNADAIRNKLVDAGWDVDDINDGLKEVQRLAPIKPIATVEAAVVAETPNVTGEVAGVTEAATPIVLAPSKSPLIKIIIIVTLILVLGGAAFAYYTFVYKPSNTVKPLINNVATTTDGSLSETSTSTIENVVSTTTIEGDVPANDSNVLPESEVVSVLPIDENNIAPQEDTTNQADISTEEMPQ